MRLLANIISYVFHPIFLLIYILEILLLINPYIFGLSDERSKALFLIHNFISLVLIPIISILILKKLNIIKSLEMEDKAERVGPLIILGVIYVWMFVNYKNIRYVPLLFTSFILGSVFSIFAAFFINNFTKISLHTLGMGGFVCAIILIFTSFDQDIVAFELFGLYVAKIDYFVFIIAAILLAGLVGTSRLFLERHTQEQVYLGYLIGFLSQLIAYSIML